MSVSVCVCVSVKSHLTLEASLHPENAVTYSAGDGGQIICGVFPETASFQSYSTPCIVRLPFSHCRIRACASIDREAEFGQWETSSSSVGVVLQLSCL